MDTSKIIKGVVSNGRYTVTAPIVKEDYGLYLKIEGVELPPTYQVDFSNSESNGTSVTMIGNADGVLIPSQFISTGKDVFAFLYHVGADFGRTVYKFRIPNKVRPDRTNEEPTPEEQSVIDQAISALNGAVAQTAQDKADADVSAQNASADADRAEEARTDAQNYATQAEQARDDAQTYANNASASATASAQSASQSAQIKADVEDLADDAQGYAQASTQSAQASANSATQAQGYANDASASAQSASQSASSASASAQTASSKAQDASGYATTASQKATESAQSASQALGYKTDAESAKTASQTAQGLAEQARNEAVSAKNDAESARDDAESARDEAQQAVASISGALDDKADIITDTASGAIASFTDGADDLPLKSLVVNIDPVQDLHGQDAPYPAGGGKNLLPYPYKSSDGVYNGITITTKSDGTIHVQGTSTSSGVTYFWLYDSNVIPSWVVAGETYGLRPVASSGKYFLQALLYGSPIFVLGGNEAPKEFPNDLSVYTRFAICVGFYSGAVVDDDIQPIFFKGSTVPSWSPYENICPISGWTEVDVEQSGKNLWSFNSSYSPTGYRVILNMVPFDLKAGTYTFSAVPNLEGDTIVLFGYHADGTRTEIARLLASTTRRSVAGTISKDVVSLYFVSNRAGTISDIQLELGSTATDYEPYTGRSININLGQTVYGGKLDVLSGEMTVYPYYASYNGETLTGEWISDRDAYAVGTTPTIGAQVVNIGAQGVTVQLEPHEVESLHGVNNLWADSGDTEAVYRADTKLYIQKKIAEAIASLS